MRRALRKVLPLRLLVKARARRKLQYAAAASLFFLIAKPLDATLFGCKRSKPRWLAHVILYYKFRQPRIDDHALVSEFLGLPAEHDGLFARFRELALRIAPTPAAIEAIEDRIMKLRSRSSLQEYVSPVALFANTNVHCYYDAFIKARILDSVSSFESRYKMPISSPLTDHLPSTSYDLWERHFALVDEKAFCRDFGRDALYLLPMPEYAIEYQGQMRYIEFAKSQIYEDWDERGFGRLQFSGSRETKRVREKLAFLGLPEDAWFVTLHVRDSGSKTGNWRNIEPGDGQWRNANIDDYDAAVDLVRSLGGYVVRVGDPAMRPFRDESKLISYWSSDLRSTEFDHYLFSECRLFIGTCSGPILFPIMYGVPTVGTNSFPFHWRLSGSTCISIPKKYRDVESGRVLSAEESLALDDSMGAAKVATLLPELGIEVLYNDPGEIADAVGEMLGLVEPISHVEQLRIRVDSLYQTSSRYGAMGKIGALWLANLSREGGIHHLPGESRNDP